MANPVIPNVPTSVDPSLIPFFAAIKGGIEHLMGQGRFKEVDRAATVSELAASAGRVVLDQIVINGNLTTQIEEVETAVEALGGDGGMVCWYYAYVPSLSNAPYSTWSTDTVRDNHVGDLFYNTLTFKAYRFKKVTTVFSWEEMTDADITTALGDAADAYTLADNKKRVFVAEPTTPYEIGDLWDTGSGIKRSMANRNYMASFASGDWELIGDVTGANTAADTALVNGIVSSIISAGASAGATAMQEIADGSISSAKLGSTLISGGYLLTSLLDVANIVCGTAELGGTLKFNTSGKITFGNADNYILGDSTYLNIKARYNVGIFGGAGYSIFFKFGTTSTYEASAASFRSYISTVKLGDSTHNWAECHSKKLLSATSVDIESGGTSDIKLDAAAGTKYDCGSSYAHTFYKSGAGIAYFTGGGLMPYSTSGSFDLGASTNVWDKSYIANYYDVRTGLLNPDTHDDLGLLADFKSRKIHTKDAQGNILSSTKEIHPETATEYLDINSLPEWTTNKFDVKQKLRNDCGAMIDEADIEAFILDEEEAGWLVYRHMSRFNDLTNGAVRQLDIEVKELVELMASRITALETKKTQEKV